MEEQVDRWLRHIMRGPDWEGLQARDRAIREMRSIGTATVFPLLARRLSAPDFDVRWAAIQALREVDAPRAVELLVPLLSDPDRVVRLVVCEALTVHGAVAAVEPLVAVLRDDSDPMVRSYAANALGHIGCPSAIPALLQAMDTDDESAMHGLAPGWFAAMALPDLLGTEETRDWIGDVDRLPETEPDFNELRRLAENRYRRWSDGPA